MFIKVSGRYNRTKQAKTVRSLIIRNLNAFDSGIYECILNDTDNPSLNKSEVIEIKISPSKEQVKFEDSHMEFNEGEVMIVKGTIEVFPADYEIDVEWVKVRIKNNLRFLLHIVFLILSTFAGKLI